MHKKLGLGTVQFGLDYGISNRQGITGLEEVKNILTFAREVGIDLIDTAYGYGKSEEVLGMVRVDRFKVVSKFLPESIGGNIDHQVKTSMKRLKTDQLYGFLAHRSLDLLEKPEVWERLQKLKKEGAVQKAGFSFNAPEEIDLVLEKGYFPDLIQAPFNYFDKRFVTHMKYLKTQGCEIHSRSAFLQGLFFVPPEELPEIFKKLKPLILELQKNKEDLPGLLLKHCIDQPYIDRVILGVNNLTQLKQNIFQLDTEKVLPGIETQINPLLLTPSEWK